MTDEEDNAPYDDNICNEITNGKQDVVTVKCDYKNINAPRRGRYVTIRRKDNASDRHLLNFCEVEVMSCFSGKNPTLFTKMTFWFFVDAKCKMTSREIEDGKFF